MQGQSIPIGVESLAQEEDWREPGVLYADAPDLLDMWYGMAMADYVAGGFRSDDPRAIMQGPQETNALEQFYSEDLALGRTAGAASVYGNESAHSPSAPLAQEYMQPAPMAQAPQAPIMQPTPMMQTPQAPIMQPTPMMQTPQAPYTAPVMQAAPTMQAPHTVSDLQPALMMQASQLPQAPYSAPPMQPASMMQAPQAQYIAPAMQPASTMQAQYIVPVMPPVPTMQAQFIAPAMQPVPIAQVVQTPYSAPAMQPASVVSAPQAAHPVLAMQPAPAMQVAPAAITAPNAGGDDVAVVEAELRAEFENILLAMRSDSAMDISSALATIFSRRHLLTRRQKHMFSEFGATLRRERQHKHSLACHMQALLLAPGDGHILFNIARAKYDLGDIPSAKTYLEQALAASPDFAVAQNFLDFLNSN